MELNYFLFLYFLISVNEIKFIYLLLISFNHFFISFWAVIYLKEIKKGKKASKRHFLYTERAPSVQKGASLKIKKIFELMDLNQF